MRIGLNRFLDSEIRFLNPVPEIRSPKSGPRNPVPEPVFEVRPWLAQGQSETLRGDDLGQSETLRGDDLVREL